MNDTKQHIIQTLRAPAVGGNGAGGELSWDPEDGNSSFGGERSSSQSETNTPRGLGHQDDGGRRGGGGGGGASASAAERLAAENLRLLTENEAVKAENERLKRMVAQLRVRLAAGGKGAGEEEDEEEDWDGGGGGRRRDVLGGRSEVSLDPSAWVGLGVPSEASFDPSEFGREPLVHLDDEDEEDEEEGVFVGEGAAARLRARGGGGGGGGEGGRRKGVAEQLSFDPSEYEGGGDSDAAGEAAEPDKCGIGVTLHRGEDELMRIISLTHGGPADLSGQVRAGDVLLEVNGQDIVAYKKPQIVALLKGRAGTKVRLELERGGQRVGAVVERDQADERVWKVLSQYSELHPEDFEDLDLSGDSEDSISRCVRVFYSKRRRSKVREHILV